MEIDSKILLHRCNCSDCSKYQMLVNHITMIFQHIFRNDFVTSRSTRDTSDVTRSYPLATNIYTWIISVSYVLVDTHDVKMRQEFVDVSDLVLELSKREILFHDKLYFDSSEVFLRGLSTMLLIVKEVLVFAWSAEESDLLGSLGGSERSIVVPISQ